MTSILKLIFVAVVAGLVSGCLAAVVVSAFGWPLSVAIALAGAGAGAAAVRGYARIKANATLGQRSARSE